jgi:hypothetical protein
MQNSHARTDAETPPVAGSVALDVGGRRLTQGRAAVMVPESSSAGADGPWVSIFGLYGAGPLVVDVALAVIAGNLRQTKGYLRSNRKFLPLAHEPVTLFA